MNNTQEDCKCLKSLDLNSEEYKKVMTILSKYNLDDVNFKEESKITFKFKNIDTKLADELNRNGFPLNEGNWKSNTW
jgi:hypothetical protein